MASNAAPTGLPITDTGFGALPIKRGKRAKRASYFIFFGTAVAVLLMSALLRKVEVYNLDEDASCCKSANSSSAVCYEKGESVSYLGLAIFTSGLLLFSVVLGTLVERATLIVEERHHVETRYGGSRWKMVRACFSGIPWATISVSIILAICIIILQFFSSKKFVYKPEYVGLVLSGIGFAPLIHRLLNLDKPSDVHISTIIEENETFVGHTLAWSYYFSHLKIVLPKVKRGIEENQRWKNKLSSNKLFILIPLDCDADKPLHELDPRVKKENDALRCERELFSIDVYRVEIETNQPKYFLIQYAYIPLKSMRSMSQYERIRSLTESKIQDETRRFYDTLKKILNQPLDSNCANTFELIEFESKAISRNDCKLADLILNRSQEHPSQERPTSVSSMTDSVTGSEEWVKCLPSNNNRNSDDVFVVYKISRNRIVSVVKANMAPYYCPSITIERSNCKTNASV